MSRAKLRTAHVYLEKGWRPVLVNGKQPSGTGWGQVLLTEEMIRESLRDDPTLNVGVVLGPGSGAIDLECDSPEAEEDFQRLFEGVEVPTTPTFRSRRGKHRVFAWDDRLDAIGKASVHFHKLDVLLGAGGKACMSVFPPSQSDGFTRKWCRGLSPTHTPLAPLPDVVVERMLENCAPRRVHEGNGHVEPGEEIVEGLRNDTLTSLGGAMRRVGTGEETILAALQEENRNRCRPPLPDSEVATIAESVSQYEPAVRTRPRDSDRPELFTDHEPCDELVDGVELLRDLLAFVSKYLVLPVNAGLLLVCWVLAAWCVDVFDRFGHLAFVSPEKRCGKTRGLEVLRSIAPRAVLSTNVSGPALFRMVETHRITLLADEAEKLSDNRSESGRAVRELLCGGIERDSVVIRCVGEQHAPMPFRVFGPKVIAMIGRPDSVLSDRCLIVPMQRRGPDEEVKPWKRRLVEQEANALASRCCRWVEDNQERIEETYDGMEPFSLVNDRLADLLLPLQVVLQLADPSYLPDLQAYAKGLEQVDPDDETLNVQLLTLLRDVFGKADFVETETLIGKLKKSGLGLSPKALGKKLRAYGVHSEHNAKRTKRGYARGVLEPVWNRYCPVPDPPLEEASIRPSVHPGPKRPVENPAKTRGKRGFWTHGRIGRLQRGMDG